MRHLPLVASALTAALAQAQTAGIIYGSGQNADLSSTFQRDSHWEIVAVPPGFTPPAAVPYAAFVPRTVPGVFYGGNNGANGSQTGYSADNNTYYWIAPQSTTSSLQGGSYNWIAAQEFEISQPGWYTFNFYASGDNAIEFFVNGAIAGAGTNTPTISGGVQIGGTFNNFGTIANYNGQAYLSAGTNIAYMVLYDFGGETAALIGQSTFEAVPEPSAYGLVLGGLALTVGVIRRRRSSGAA